MDKTIPKKPFLFYYRCTKPHLKWAIAAVLSVLFASLTSDYLVVVLSNLTDSLAAKPIDPDEIWKSAVLYPVFYLISHLLWRSSGLTGMQWFNRARETGFNMLYKHTARHSKSYFNDKFAGSLVTNISNAVENSESLFQRILWTFLPQLFSLAAFIYFTTAENIWLGGVLAGWTVIFLGINYLFVRRLQPGAVRVNELRSVLKGKMVDSFSNISLVHEHTHLKGESDYIARSVRDHRIAGIKNWQQGEMVLTVNGFMIVVFIIGMLWTSLSLLTQGAITIGVVVMVIAIITDITGSLFHIGGEMIEAGKEYSGISEGLNETAQQHSIKDAGGAGVLAVTAGALSFNNVTFNYGNSEVFNRLSVSIKPGEKVGLVGRSGAGKSTFVSLLLRHYDVDGGSITIDGQDIAKVKLESLRKAIAFVPQDTSLFHRTIRENIQYGNPGASQADIERVAELARANGFISKLKNGYDTLVGERGVRLSGGQRQRIAIARAFLKDAPILVLDEATSSLDSESEREIQKALSVLMYGRTVIAIAHRLSTLKEMDRIILIEDGIIVEDGAPQDLLRKKDGIFKSLWDRQVSGFIVDDAENTR